MKKNMTVMVIFAMIVVLVSSIAHSEIRSMDGDEGDGTNWLNKHRANNYVFQCDFEKALSLMITSPGVGCGWDGDCYQSKSVCRIPDIKNAEDNVETIRMQLVHVFLCRQEGFSFYSKNQGEELSKHVDSVVHRFREIIEESGGEAPDRILPIKIASLVGKNCGNIKTGSPINLSSDGNSAYEFVIREIDGNRALVLQDRIAEKARAIEKMMAG